MTIFRDELSGISPRIESAARRHARVAGGRPPVCPRGSQSAGRARPVPPLCPRLGLALILVLLRASVEPGEASPQPQGQQQPSAHEAFLRYLGQLRERDTCGAVYTGKVHGYDVREYKIVTKDNYELTLHRLVHPEDYARRSAPPRKRKPYLLVHGLIGTSASFLLNVEDHYQAPPVTFKSGPILEELLRARADQFEFDWKSTAELHQRRSLHEQAPSRTKKNVYARLNTLDYDGDQLNFAREYRQAYRKFHLPRDSLGYTTNSLAFTLSNFGYDVWLVNLRGNAYSRGFNGPLSASHAEYWDFNIETIIKEDLVASIQFILREVQCDEPIGLVTYSYSGAHALGLLKKFPKYLEQVQPVVMLAPTLLTATNERGKTKYFLRVSDMLVSKNGPFPVLGRSSALVGRKSSLLSLSHLDTKLESLACSLPLASKLCRLLEMVIHGESQQVASVRGLLANDRSAGLMKRDNECGQTSKQILHQIFRNLREESIHPDFQPWLSARNLHLSRERSARNAPIRRSVILIHSQDDQISTPVEVQRLRDQALKTHTLIDYTIVDPNFGHSDFLFSRKNQFLVNAEIVRQVLLFDRFLYKDRANRLSEAPRGY